MHPTGVLRKADWTGPEKLFEPIFSSITISLFILTDILVAIYFDESRRYF
jgi:hypothetical protein